VRRKRTLIFFLALSLGSAQAGMTFACLVIGLPGLYTLYFALLSGFSFYAALSEHDGVEWFPILRRRR
jgi:hypothetical protein